MSVELPRATGPSGRFEVQASSRVRALGDGLAIISLLLFSLVFYRQLTLEGRVIVSFDALVYFYPNLTYLGASLQEGRLPLWNPYLFVGAPFLANSQTGVFYPPNWLVLALPAASAYAWSAMLHATLAALGTYAFARRALGVSCIGALGAALVFAFGGFFSAQAGHLNQLQAASWLPLLLLVGDGLLRRPRAPLAVLGGVVLCLLLLPGHSQVAYLSLWALLLYALAFCAGAFLDGLRAGQNLRRLAVGQLPRLWPLALLGAVGAGLAAAQLLPTYELSRESIRASGLSYDDAASFSLPPWKVLLGLLPTFGDPPVFSEWVGYVGLTGLSLAGLALATRPDRRAAAMLLIAGTALGLAFGEFNPAYPLVYWLVPGLDLFRVPARWLLLYGFGLAGLAGLGLDWLVRLARDVAPRHAAERRRPPALPIVGRLAGLAFAAVGVLGLYQVVQRGYPLELPGAVTLLSWGIVGALALGLIALALAFSPRPRAVSAQAGSRPGTRSTALLPVVCLVLLGAELLAASASLDLNRGNLPEAVTEVVPEARFVLERPGLYRVLGVSENTFEIGRVEVLRDRVADRLSPEGVYDYLVAMKHKKTFTPNLPLAHGIATLDGYDGGVLPLRRYVGLKTLFPREGENLPDGRLRVQLRTAPDPHLLGWLNVRYLVMDRARDVWLDGVYYDLAMVRAASPGRPLLLPDLSPFSASALGIVTHLEEADAPPGAEVAAITVFCDDGRSYRLPVRAGVETADGKPLGAPPLKTVAPWLHDPAGHEYAARLAFPETVSPSEIAVEYLWPRGRLAVRAISLVGAEPGAERVVDLSSDLKLVYLGDAKIYEHRSALPRAFIVGRVRLASDDEAELELLRPPDFDARREAVVSEAEWRASGGGTTELGASAEAVVVEYRPERVVVETHLASPGLLVLSDAFYPGWRALVDGQESPILRVDHAFRGVRLEAGWHRVEFVYQPTSLRVGLAISGATAVAAMVICVARPARRLDGHGGSARSEAVPRDL